MEKTFSDAMNYRHACKVFDDTKKINSDDLNYILEAGRKSPSSFGMEPWKFLVISNDELRAKIRPVCWDQPQITTSSHLVIMLAAIDTARVESGIPAKRFARREMPQEQQDFYLGLYGNHLKDTLDTEEHTYSWTARQCYIAAGNMMTAGAIKGVDSCPIEGFEKENLEKILELDTSKYQVAIVLPFGYRLNEQSSQLREKFEDVVEFID